MSDNKTNRKLAAIMFADIVSYSRLMGANESETLKLLNDFEEISAKIIEKFEGTIIKKNGDQIFCEFSSAKNAVDASLELQNKLSEYNDSRPKDYKLEVRIGIHIGDIVKKENDIFGDGVNVAARIQPLASPGGICVSGAVSESLSSHPDYDIISKGEQDLKNILQKHTIFQIKTGHEAIEPVISKSFIKTKEKSSNPNAKYWIIISPFLLIAILFSFLILQKIVKDAIKSFSSNESNTVESVNDSGDDLDILLFGNIFSEPEDISDITLFYEKGKEATLPENVELISLSKIELDNIYDELLSSIQANVFIGDLEVHSKYDLDKFYKEKNDLVPEYKIKTFNMQRKIATGEIDVSDISNPKSEAFKIFQDQLYNSDTYIMGQYHRVGFGYFPIIYKLSNSYQGGDYLVVGHIKYDSDPREAMQIDPKWEMQIVNESNIVGELTEMLVTLLSQAMKSYTKTENLLDKTLVVSKSSGNKILFKKYLFTESSDTNNKFNNLQPRMIFEASRFYINKEMSEILDKSTLESIAEKRLNDLQEYKNKIDNNKNSKQYKEFYKDGNDEFAYDNNIEYESLLNKTHSLYTASNNSRITFIMPLGITVKIDEVFDSTGSATIYKKHDPFKVLKEGDILIRK